MRSQDVVFLLWQLPGHILVSVHTTRDKAFAARLKATQQAEHNGTLFTFEIERRVVE